MTSIRRRTLLSGSALAAGATALPAHVPPAAAAASPAGKQAPGVYRYKIGSYELTAINDGTWMRNIDDKFVRNVAYGEVQKEMAAGFMPGDIVPTYFTTLLVNTGSKLVLIDTGTGGQLAPPSGTLAENLAAAGIDPRSIDTILISHFHPDHINGIKTKDNALFFPNAEIMVPAPEWAHWMDDAKLNAAPQAARPAWLNVRRIFADIAKDVRQYEPGKELVPGITSIAAFGHTPGHTVFAVASGNQSMMALSDTTNHPWLFLRNPDWHGAFDTDPIMAAETRRKLLDRAAADRMLVQGYHFPFPASGYIAKDGGKYAYVPAPWQPVL